MKKNLFILFVLFSCSFVYSQTDVNERLKGTATKSGQQYLPKAGDFSIGIDASTPYFMFGGKIMNKIAGMGTPSAGAFSDLEKKIRKTTVMGKYFLEDNVAIRGNLTVDFSSKKNISQEPKIGGKADEKVDNSISEYKRNLLLEAGYEIRRGYGRLQAFFGPQASLGFGSNEGKNYTYGNVLNSEYGADDGFIRPLHETSSFVFLGAGGFAGVEYFVLPKLALGFELGCGLGYNITGKEKLDYEIWKDSKSEKKTEEFGGKREFDWTTYYSGSLTLNFYF